MLSTTLVGLAVEAGLLEDLHLLLGLQPERVDAGEPVVGGDLGGEGEGEGEGGGEERGPRLETRGDVTLGGGRRGEGSRCMLLGGRLARGGGGGGEGGRGEARHGGGHLDRLVSGCCKQGP